MTPDWIESLPGYTPASREVELAGLTWQSNGEHAIFTTVDRGTGPGPFRLLRVERAGNGAFNWRSSLCLKEREWYVHATGAAETVEAAAIAALAYQHATRTVGGVTWYGGDRWEARIDGQELVVIQLQREEIGQAWHWERALHPSITAAFTGAGLELFDDLAGTTETAEDAMAAAVDALTLLRHACRQVLALTAATGAPQ